MFFIVFTAVPDGTILYGGQGKKKKKNGRMKKEMVSVSPNA